MNIDDLQVGSEILFRRDSGAATRAKIVGKHDDRLTVILWNAPADRWTANVYYLKADSVLAVDDRSARAS
jgi:hypothetical protein